MFLKLCALLRKKPETVSVSNFPAPKKKPTVKKATTRTVKKPTTSNKLVTKKTITNKKLKK